MKSPLSIVFLSALPLAAQLDVEFSNTKHYMLSDARKAQYLEGVARVSIEDGSWTLSPCIHPWPEIIRPNPLVCPLGTTGFIWQGDGDRDGIRDDGSYWSIESITAASYIMPNKGDLVTLVSAPQSKLQRPQNNFIDNSTAVTYNVLAGFGRLYNIAIYDLITDYGFGDEIKHKEEYVPGLYRFTVPALANPILTYPLNLQLYPAPESTGTVRGNLGFSISGGRWSKGSMELDPRVITNFGWSGINYRNTIATDSVYFAIYAAQALTGDITQPERILYPTPDVPQLLDSPIISSLQIVPFAFKKGDRGVARIRWARNLATTRVSFDRSQRLFDWRMRFVDSYEGHMLNEYPIGTALSRRITTADYDLDRVSNFDEFAFTQDDGDDRSTTVEAGADAQTQPVMPAMVVDPVTLKASMTVNKRLAVGSSVIYSVQYSTNGRSWTTITARDRLFDIVEDSEIKLEVRTKNVAPRVLFMRAVAKPWR